MSDKELCVMPDCALEQIKDQQTTIDKLVEGLSDAACDIGLLTTFEDVGKAKNKYRDLINSVTEGKSE